MTTEPLPRGSTNIARGVSTLETMPTSFSSSTENRFDLRGRSSLGGVRTTTWPIANGSRPSPVGTDAGVDSAAASIAGGRAACSATVGGATGAGVGARSGEQPAVTSNETANETGLAQR